MRRSAVALLLLAIPASVLAHGGGLDANGCHTNRKTGDYHCHRAPAPPPPAPVAAPRATTPSSSSVNSLYSSPAAAASGSAAAGVATERQLILTAQLLLLALGYSPGKQDGVLTATTTAAVRQFQADRSLAQDGLVTGSLLVRLAEQVALRAKTP